MRPQREANAALNIVAGPRSDLIIRVGYGVPGTRWVWRPRNPNPRFLYPVMGADHNPGPVAGPAEIGIVRDAAQFVW